MFSPLHGKLLMTLDFIVIYFNSILIIYLNLHNVLNVTVTIKWINKFYLNRFLKLLQAISMPTVQKSNKMTFRIYSWLNCTGKTSAFSPPSDMQACSYSYKNT